MLSINTNLPSLIAQTSLKTSTNKLNTAIERMTTGCKINSAKDNAANYSIATNMTTKIGAYQVAEENVAMGLDFITTASDSLDLIADKLSRLRALSEQASNGTYGASSLNAINSEANSIIDEIVRVYNSAEYNGIKLFAGDSDSTTYSSDKVQSAGFLKKVNRRSTVSMKQLADVDANTTISNGSYSISTAEELAKLATMTNNGKITGGDFVLANDIDLSGYDNWTPIGMNDDGWGATFDGNGYSISNLNISSLLPDMPAGLFAFIQEGEVKNLEIVGANVNADYAGVLASQAWRSVISNCSISGSIAGTNVGGMLARGVHNIIDLCYVNIDMKAEGGDCGGFESQDGGDTKITNCVVTGNIVNNGASHIGGYIGDSQNAISNNPIPIISNSYMLIESDDLTQLFYGYFNPSSGGGDGIIRDCYYSSYYNDKSIPVLIPHCNQSVAENVRQASASYKPALYKTNPALINGHNTLRLQVGITGEESSSISIETSFVINNLDYLRGIGLNNNDTLSVVDEILSDVSTKQTEFGAIQNRLESALDEISTQYENLVSSRSTLKDADIAEVSSEYIRQQILQQASATLLATANQSPALALQLI
ncbi:MAG: hypothetical protein NC408_03890 [Candidatus Gastranaerophilales bacterium]|nr:hypothetical protein [Candidatus Gastranaerophilales bacterium]MCM1073109.1 hypothetical protein [Bacteroides sp.]